MSSILAGLDNQILTEARTYKLWENAGHKIMEAQLTADQIKQLFANIEQGATASGDNRTMLGKGKDAAGAVSKAWEDLKGKVYNSGPMNNFAAAYDKQAEKLKQATGGDQGVFKYVQKYRDFAEKHPIIQGFVYSALIAAAGVTGAGLGGAAVLGLFKLTDQLLQGKDIRSAIYQGAKTGALAYGASKLGDLIKGKPEGGTGGTGVPSGSGLTGDMSYDEAYKAYIAKFAQDPDNPSAMIIKQAKQFAATKAKEAALSATDAASNAASNFDANKAIRIAQELRGRAAADASEAIRNAISNGEIRPDMVNNAAGIAQSALDKYLANGSLSPTMVDTISRKAAMMAASQAGMNESIDLNEATIKILFSKVSLEHSKRIDEGIMDTLKGAAGKAMDYAKTKGHNLTTKITADKLNTAWEKAGKPTDSDQIATILKSNGVPEDVVKNVFAQMKIPVVAAPAAGQQPAQGAAPAQPAAKPAAQQPAATPAQIAKPQPGVATPAASTAQPATAPAQKPGAVNKTPPKPNAPTAGTRTQKGAFAYNPLAEGDFEVHVPGFGTVPLEMLKRHVKELAKDFNDIIQSEEFIKAAYKTEQLYNALFALSKAMKSKSSDIDETISTGLGGGSAGIGGGSGLGIDKSPMEKVLEKPLGEDTAYATGGGQGGYAGQSYRKFTPKSAGTKEEQLNELSPELLARYKKAAGADASKADKAGDFKRGDKRFSGIVRATKKEFDKAVKEEQAPMFTPEAAQNFDKQFGVPLTPQGAQAFMKQPIDQRMKSMQAAKAAGYKYDNQTGVFTAPAGAAPAKKTPPVIPGKRFYGNVKPGELNKGVKRSELPIQQPAAATAAAAPAATPAAPAKPTRAQRQQQWDKESQERRQQALQVAASLPPPAAQPPATKPAGPAQKIPAGPMVQYNQPVDTSDFDDDDREDLAYSNKVLQQQAVAGNKQAQQALELRKKQGLAEAMLGMSLAWPEVVDKVNKVMKATGWNGKRKEDGTYIYTTKGAESDDQYYFVIIENKGSNLFSYALGTVEDGRPDIGEQNTLPMTEASVSELINSIREGFGLAEAKMVNANDPKSDGWRVYKAAPAGYKESAIMKGLQTEGNVVTWSKDNPPPPQLLLNTLIQILMKPENHRTPQELISLWNNKYGLKHTLNSLRQYAQNDYKKMELSKALQKAALANESSERK